MNYLVLIPYTYTALLVFYTLYIAAINIYYDWDKLTGWVQVLAFSPLVIMLMLDMVMNLTLFTFLFFDFPREGMVTQRLARYRDGADGWRKTVATAICTQALNPFDPTRKHC